MWKWHRSQSVDDVYSCKDLRTRAAIAIDDEIKEIHVQAAYRKALDTGICLASDDPRLKEK